jgi:hypothetical protein
MPRPAAEEVARARDAGTTRLGLLVAGLHARRRPLRRRRGWRRRRRRWRGRRRPRGWRRRWTRAGRWRWRRTHRRRRRGWRRRRRRWRGRRRPRGWRRRRWTRAGRWRWRRTHRRRRRGRRRRHVGRRRRGWRRRRGRHLRNLRRRWRRRRRQAAQRAAAQHLFLNDRQLATQVLLVGVGVLGLDLARLQVRRQVADPVDPAKDRRPARPPDTGEPDQGGDAEQHDRHRQP